MPEIKHTFTAGKMNKDLDERLVRNGEYRDALNIQVRTSNDGASGTVQNIQGNTNVGSSYYAEWMSELPQQWENPSQYSQYPRCIASVADEKSDKAYFFFASATHPPLLAVGSQSVGKRRIYVDTIIEQNASTNNTIPIVVDHFATVDTIHGVVGTNNYYDFDTVFPTDGWSEIPLNPELDIDYRIDMTVRVLNSEGADVISPGKIKAIDVDNLRLLLHEPMVGDIGLGGIWFLFEAPRVLNFSQGEVLSNANPSNIITGINVVDNLLMWTDNFSEPKKINIDRCRKGSNPSSATQNGKTHTKLYVEDSSIDSLVEVSELAHQLNSDPTNSDLKEEHITVIRKSPRTAPTLEMSKWDRNESLQNVVTVDYVFVNGGTNPNVLMGETHEIQDSSLLQSDYLAGDLLNFTENGDTDEEDTMIIKAQFVSYIEDGVEVDYVTDTILISIIADNTNVQTIDNVWDITIELEKPLFEFKFPRFGYRYKYEDNEYSTFSPWSELAFLPDEFEYNPAKGYNLGMINTIRKLVVKDFIPYKIPLDVKAIYILFKTTDAANVYVVETIERTKDNEWIVKTPDGLDTTLEIGTGELKITSEMIHKMLDANQTLRTWDNVPRIALAQDIIGNRVVYGNYKQGYNIKGNVNLNPKIISEATPTLASPKKSIKTLRDYKIGVVYGDKYGRETPVLTSKYTIYNNAGDDSTSLTAGLTVDKTLCGHQNKFEVSQNWEDSDMIQNDWIDYVKYYVKETSNEYYNLIMDRWYNSGDGGTIWMSFNSADRNKVKEGDYLILKNKHGTEEPVLEKARYKILAIKNEAPDYIKKSYLDLPGFPNPLATTQGMTPQNTDSEGTADGGIATAGSVWTSTSFSDAGSMYVGVQQEQPTGLYESNQILISQHSWRLANQGSFTTSGNETDGFTYTPQGDPFYGDTAVPADEHVEMRVVGQMMDNTQSNVLGEMKSHWRRVSTRTYTTGQTNHPMVKIAWDRKFDQLGDGGVDMLTRFNNAEEAGDTTFNADASGSMSGSDQMAGGLRYMLEFRRIKTENKPEFDGKFFVKIEKDLLVSENVSILGLNLGYEDGETLDISYINSSYLNDSVQEPQSNPTTGTAIDTEALFDDTTEASDWFFGMYQGIMGDGDDPAAFDQGGNGAPDYDGVFDYIIDGVAGMGDNYNGVDVNFVDEEWPEFFDNQFNYWEQAMGSAYLGDYYPSTLTEESVVYPYVSNDPATIATNVDTCDWPNFSAQGIINTMYNHFMDVSVMGSCFDNSLPGSWGDGIASTMELAGVGPGQGGGENFVLRNRNFWQEWEQNHSRVFLDGASCAIGAMCNNINDMTGGNVHQGNGGEGDGLNTAAGTPYNTPSIQSQQGVEIGRGWKPFTFRQGVMAIAGAPNQIGASEGMGAMTLSFAVNKPTLSAPANLLALTQTGQRFYWKDDTTGDDGTPVYYKVIGVVFESEGGICNYWQNGYADPYDQEMPSWITACERGAVPNPEASNSGAWRVTYRIEFRKIDKITDGVTTIGMDLSTFDPRAYLHHDGRDSIKLQLVDLVDIGNESGGDEHAEAEKGACWETEPQEDVDLELYYEASNAIPMILNKDNAFDFALPNSQVNAYRYSIFGGSNINKQLGLGDGNPRLNNIHFTHDNSETAIMALVHDDENNEVALLNNHITIGDELEFVHPNDGVKTRAKVTKIYRPIDDSPNGEAFVDMSVQDSTSGIISGPKAFEEVTPIEYSVMPVEDGGQTVYTFDSFNFPPIGTVITNFLVEIGEETVSVPIPGNITITGAGIDLTFLGVPVAAALTELNGVQNNFALGQAWDNWYSTLTLAQQNDVNPLPKVQSLEATGYYGIDVNVWKNSVTLGWHNCYAFGNGVESDRVADDYNAPQIDNGNKVSTTFSGYQEEQISSGLIYSGIYNSTSEVNNLNEFNQAEKITKQLNPRHGSIQRIKSRDTDAVIFTEDKVLKVLANKDALFNADGNTQLTATDKVLGQIIPYAGDYGISKNPESLAWDQYRMYFTDKARGAVLRLSKDGLTPISNVGMSDWFRTNMRSRNEMLGSFDTVAKEYNLSLKYNYEFDSIYTIQTSKTLSFSETTKGWVSFKSFVPSQGLSINGKYLTTYNHKIWEHHTDAVDRNTFYDMELVPSQVSVMFNDNPSVVKSFRTINYEGSQAKITAFNGIVMDAPTGGINLDANDLALSVPTVPVNLNDNEYYNLFDKNGWWCPSCQTDLQIGTNIEFKDKEGKWFARVPKEAIYANYDGLNNLDTSEITVQGIGELASNAVVTGTITEIDEDGNDTIVAGILGCMDFNADNYNELATIDDGSCEYGVIGCMDPASPSYSQTANIHSQGMCDNYIIGCMVSNAYNYNPYATQNGYCLEEDGVTVVPGCGPTASSWVFVEDYNCYFDTFSEDVILTDSDGDSTGVTLIYGCMDPLAANYDANATINAVSETDNSTPCWYLNTPPTITGCMESTACNYNPWANVADDSCEWESCSGCTDYSAFNFQPWAIIPCASCCCYSYDECTGSGDFAEDELIEADPDADGTNGDGTNGDGTNGDDDYTPTDTSSDCPDGQIFVGAAADGGCEDIVYGCTNEFSASYNPLANVMDITMCEEYTGAEGEVFGCTDPTAFNYNPDATTNDGSCEPVIEDCMDNSMINYNTYANTPCEGCCIPYIYGCTDSTAFNYDSTANTDDGSCVPIVYGCMDPLAANYNENANMTGFENDDTGGTPCVYLDEVIPDPFEITVQNYPNDSDSLDQQ